MIGSGFVAPPVVGCINCAAVVICGVDAVFRVVEDVVVMGDVIGGRPVEVYPYSISQNSGVGERVVIGGDEVDSVVVVRVTGVVRERVVVGVAEVDAVPVVVRDVVV